MRTDQDSFDFIVIGSGPCGATAACELSKLSTGRSIALIGREVHHAYNRPDLSKSLLRLGGEPVVPILKHLAGLGDLGVTIVAGDPVAHVHLRDKRVALQSGRSLEYGKLLVATGAAPRSLAIPGHELAGVHVLRTFEDAAGLSSAVSEARNVVVVGGGFIGLETAASVRGRGIKVTVLERCPRLMSRGVPGLIAEMVLSKFLEEGVDVRLGAGIVGIKGDDRVTSVLLDSGEEIPAEVVVIGVGVSPNVEFLAGEDIQIENGVVTDAFGRTSDPSVFAAGDVASMRVEVAGVPHFYDRSEAWDPALEQGGAVARIMTEASPQTLPPPWMWSDQFNWNIQMAGYGDLADREVVRRNQDSDSVTILRLRGKQLMGAVTLNAARDMVLLRRSLYRELDTSLLERSDTRLRDILSPKHTPAGVAV